MITCTAATNSAPSSRYSTASDAITTTSDSALLIGWLCTSRLIAPATQIAPKTRNSTRCSIFLYVRLYVRAPLQYRGDMIKNGTQLPGPSLQDLRSPAGTGTSSRRPSVGHNGSAAVCHAPRYT